MLLSFSRRAPARITARHLSDARRHGRGVYVREWRPATDQPVDGLVDGVLAWCRETLAGTRRPWGIADFDLALAVRGASHGTRTLSLQRLAPGDLYGDALVARISRFVAQEPAAAAHLAVALFSWGDAAHDALPPA